MSEPEPQPECGSCRFYEQHVTPEGPQEYGSCRRGLRHVQVAAGIGVHVLDLINWPVHVADDWCGEYKPQE